MEIDNSKSSLGGSPNKRASYQSTQYAQLSLGASSSAPFRSVQLSMMKSGVASCHNRRVEIAEGKIPSLRARASSVSSFQISGLVLAAEAAASIALGIVTGAIDAAAPLADIAAVPALVAFTLFAVLAALAALDAAVALALRTKPDTGVGRAIAVREREIARKTGRAIALVGVSTFEVRVSAISGSTRIAASVEMTAASSTARFVSHPSSSSVFRISTKVLFRSIVFQLQLAHR